MSDEEELDDNDVENIKRRYHSCSDGMCGSEDCKRCHLGWSEDEEVE